MELKQTDLTNNRWMETDQWPMTNFYASIAANTIKAKLANHF